MGFSRFIKFISGTQLQTSVSSAVGLARRLQFLALCLWGFRETVPLRGPVQISSKQSKYFTLHIFILASLLRTTFPPFHRPPWVAPAHPERTKAALDSPKANAARGIISAAHLRGQSGELRPTVICCEVADKISTINYLEL